MKIIKAWKLNTTNIEEPWYYSDNTYYGTRGQAKSKALADLDGCKSIKGEDINFLSVSLIRSKEDDICIIDGKEKTLRQIQYDNCKKERDLELDSIVTNNPNGYAYIKKNGYYYRPNNCGYTEYSQYAGVYPVKAAVSEIKGCSLGDNMMMILTDRDSHNKLILEGISTLEKNLIL